VLSNQNPTIQMWFGGAVLWVRPSPCVAAFSSRGPSTLVPELLKPDMIGLGLNVLAGWTRSAGLVAGADPHMGKLKLVFGLEFRN
jgi:hypothetical protein